MITNGKIYIEPDPYSHSGTVAHTTHYYTSPPSRYKGKMVYTTTTTHSTTNPTEMQVISEYLSLYAIQIIIIVAVIAAIALVLFMRVK